MRKNKNLNNNNKFLITLFLERLKFIWKLIMRKIN